MLKGPGELHTCEQLSLSARLFALALNYHLSLLQASTEDLHSRHAQAMGQMYRQPGFEQCIAGDPEPLSAALLSSSQSFFGR